MKGKSPSELEGSIPSTMVKACSRPRTVVQGASLMQLAAKVEVVRKSLDGNIMSVRVRHRAPVKDVKSFEK